MSILDNLREQRTGMVRESDFKKSPIIDIGTTKTGEIRLDTLDRNEEYELFAKIGVKFWANAAQYGCQRRMAEKVLLNRLYGDTLSKLSEAKKAIFDGDAKAALEAIDSIRTELIGD